ncbi:serum paraoxonase/arylesterase 2-like [Dunckerocampus dactyliophorus]|uniref:serum paraoxonase/arylesterase 2-like n=1 Tax=Dunckerocampus dactyliophorus TaxID=161453 RepID=UPI0024057586|nr:serum paraoxonase/arylesterase 2-like [Dunckerocampus dactyliophorus]
MPPPDTCLHFLYQRHDIEGILGDACRGTPQQSDVVSIEKFAAPYSRFAVLLGQRIVNLRNRSLASRELVKNHLPNCVPLKNLNDGSEDMTVFGDGLAFVSTGLKFPGMPSSDVPGKIFLLDLKDSRMKPVELRMPRNFDLETFNPHGISAHTDTADGTVYLFVVNHPHHKSQVELFKFVEEEFSLLHLKTFRHELLHSVNDIVAMGVDRFYATNDHYYSDERLKTIVEPLLCQPWTNVVYYSPETVKVVSEGYYMANGINVSPDKRHIYVADVLDHNVHVLERTEDNALVSVKSVAVSSLCDNIEVDPKTGDLWLGCHPNGWKFLNYDPKDPPGSEVIRIRNIHSEEPLVTQVYADDGHVIVGSSVATTYGGKLLIGSVFHKALCCDLE